MSDIHKTKIRQLDFTLLLILQGLLRYGRTVDVANELGLSQPAVSHALRRLRELFDDPLFVRKPHGLTPTHHAKALAPLVEAMLAGAHDAVGLSGRFDPGSSTRDFRIAAPDLLGPLIVAPLRRQFEKSAPGARFALRTLVGEEAIVALRQDQLDVAVGQFVSKIDGLSVDHLYDDIYVLVTRARHPTRGKTVTKKILAELGFVTMTTSGEFRGFTDDELEQQGLRRKIVASVPRFSTALEMVRHTDDALLAPMRLVSVYSGPFKLELRKLPIRLRPFRVVMVQRRGPDAGREWFSKLIHGTLREAASSGHSRRLTASPPG